MPGKPTVVYRAANLQQAHVLRLLLEECGIKASVQDALSPETSHTWSGAPRVVVGADDLDDALIVAREFDQRSAQTPTAESESPLHLEEDDWPDWPGCPQCRERRSARCPVCHTSGTDFPLADVQESAAGPRVLLVCATCDDHMLPDWYRRCPRCGHDFGAGIEFAVAPLQSAEFNPRAAAILVLLGSGALAALAYVAWLFYWPAR